jgi:hypothetical protein
MERVFNYLAQSVVCLGYGLKVEGPGFNCRQRQEFFVSS